MSSAMLVFSNGDKLILKENQLVTPIIKYTNNSEVMVSEDKSFEIWNHIHNGLIPSIAEMLCKSDYFRLIDDHNKIYNSSAVVTVENI